MTAVFLGPQRPGSEPDIPARGQPHPPRPVGVSTSAQAQVQPPAMHRRRLALGLGFCLLAGTSLSVLWVYLENWLPVSHVPYYLPCPEIFPMMMALSCLCHQQHEAALQEGEATPAHGHSTLSPSCWSTGEGLSAHGPPAARPTQLLTLTPWLAPIVSEGTFNPELLQHIYQPLNLTIGVTVFAVGKYTHFIQSFLESAEEFFMRGYRVHYYIFTDNPAAIPGIPLGPHRLLSSIPIQGHSHWEETSMRRMETISQHIAKRAHREVDYLFCLDVDMVFRNPWGPETLGDLVAAIHPSYYAVSRQQFPYERRRVSTAFVADSEGDFYYGGAVFGGQVARVYEFTRGCHMAILADKANGIMAAWREESHLNRHFISNKPSKVLSPKYLWDDRKPQPPSLKLIRFSTLDKDISCLRS
ncbi:globoside alpha-1,3-N-acetylgalactosaminyltransferase 1 isoform X1 [Pan troglodytes]|uniref:globoside alpha-1,3-N-acetylgalactosaminyltransferase 1 isoform X1 n=3 Tax=Pan troglodytes TaxID=9598 RepID=UPI0023F42CE1|nr:globoside alpha-1,3-N-acetylgalactosaminyltransferase 1 isoform X1 [Pan troglodytes]